MSSDPGQLGHFGAQRRLPEESALLSSAQIRRCLRSSSAATSSGRSRPSLGSSFRADGQFFAGTCPPASPATAPPAARARRLRPPSRGRSRSGIPQAPGDRLGVLSGSRARLAGSGRDSPRFVEDPAPVCDARGLLAACPLWRPVHASGVRCARRGQVCPSGGQTGYRGASDPLYAYGANFLIGIFDEQVCRFAVHACP